MKYKKIIIIILVVAVIAAAFYFLVIKPFGKAFKQPVNGKITSPFGFRNSPTSGASTNHNGVDFGVPTGTPVKSPLDGEILRIWSDTHGGKCMQVVHAKGWITGYAHLSGYNKKVGNKVKQFDVVAFSGNTGTSTGAHLHFTLTNPQGVKVNPELYFNKELV